MKPKLFTLGYDKSQTKHNCRNAAMASAMSRLPKSCFFSTYNSKTKTLSNRFKLKKNLSFTYSPILTARKKGPDVAGGNSDS